MSLDPELQHIPVLFATLQGPGSATFFPELQSLSIAIKAKVKSQKNGTVNINEQILKMYATGSVEAWQRGLHSFLISASLTDTSAIWASVAGYYASHYVMRAFSHLFGFFQLHTQGVIVELDPENMYSLKVKRKGSDGEHKLYWKYVKKLKLFQNNVLFTDNPEPPNTKFSTFLSDQGHRNKANYVDHIGHFTNFTPLNTQQLQARIEYLSNLDINDPSIPDVSKYPDIINVQLVAYRRLIAYRALLDMTLPIRGFWARQRSPHWIPDYFDFQATEVSYTTMYDDYVNI